MKGEYELVEELKKMDETALKKEYQELNGQYEAARKLGLKLDMSRGKPCPEQLDLSAELMNCLDAADYLAKDGTDCRNYGGLDGLGETKALFGEIIAAAPAEIIIGGNSSLTLMHDVLVRLMLHGAPESEMPWGKLPKVKFLCPSPGYDRHFAICEYLGIEMINIAYLADGPDMAEVERLVAEDPAIKGIWCVPKYSNPIGNSYSDAVVDRLATMKTAAPDFRIFWDNAYVVHHLGEKRDVLKNLRAACAAVGHANRVFEFASTSKITFPGAGVALVASSEANCNWLRKEMSFQSIGPDKLNQLRHIRFFGDAQGLEKHMARHAAILKPKFDLVSETLQNCLGQSGLADWSKPLGGYFISLDTLPGCAKKVVAMAKEAGVVLTGAGATYPYGKDPDDRNIRLAPSFPSLSELKQAMELVCLCVRLVSVRQELEARGAALR